jgi:hypothetical protein
MATFTDFDEKDREIEALQAEIEELEKTNEIMDRMYDVLKMQMDLTIKTIVDLTIENCKLKAEKDFFKNKLN